MNDDNYTAGFPDPVPPLYLAPVGGVTKLSVVPLPQDGTSSAGRPKWNVGRFATAALGGEETPENAERATAWTGGVA